jgi:hypothetical protein
MPIKYPLRLEKNYPRSSSELLIDDETGVKNPVAYWESGWKPIPYRIGANVFNQEY